MRSISTRASFGNRATCTVARAGYGSEKNVPYTAFMAAKSFMSARKTVVRTTSANERFAGFEDRTEVVEDAPRLRGDIAVDDRAGDRVGRDLT